MRAVIVTDTGMQIPVNADWFDRLVQQGGSAARTHTNGPGEQWIIQPRGEKPMLLIVNSNSEASETLAVLVESEYS